MDDWLVEFSMVQSATSTLGTAQKRAPSGRRYKKRSANDEATAEGCPENFVSVVSLFDEYVNDLLYLREGSCFPRCHQFFFKLVT